MAIGLQERLAKKPFRFGGKSLKLWFLKKAAMYFVQFGEGAPTGTPKAFLYINTIGTTATTRIWVAVNGAWVNLTIS